MMPLMPLVNTDTAIASPAGAGDAAGPLLEMLIELLIEIPLKGDG